MIARGIQLAHEPIHRHLGVRDALLLDLQRPDALFQVVVGHQYRYEVVLLLLLDPERVIDADRRPQLLFLWVAAAVVQSCRLPGSAVGAPISVVCVGAIVLLHHRLGGS